MFPPHSSNFISASSALALSNCPYVNMVTITLISSPRQKTRSMDVSFTPLDLSYSGQLAPLYIPAKINGNTITGVMVDSSCRINVTIEEVLFINGLHQVKYYECHATI